MQIAMESARERHADPAAIPLQASAVTRATREDANIAGAMRVALEPHLAEILEKIIAAAKSGKRTAINAVVRIATAANANDDVLRAMALALGATSVAHMKAAASSALDAEHQDDATLWAESEAFVQQYRREHGLPPLIEDPRWRAHEQQLGAHDASAAS